MEMSRLQRVYEAFVHGRDRPPSKAFTAPGRLFGELLNAKMHSRLSPEESKVVESCWGGQYRGLLATRKDQIEQAKQEFEKVRSVLQAGSLSAEASLLVQVLLEPAEAYLYYKLDDYERAREFVARSSSFNHRLSDEFGYEIISAQRMQLCHNILRIHTKQGQRRKTVMLAS